MFITIIVFIITLLILVLIHELGHFLVAKKFNIKVEEFGFGIPPKAWSKKIGETEVSLNWLPFGGFVRLEGEDEVNKKILADPRSFATQTVYKRILVVVAGVVMNLLLAWLLFYIVLGFQGFKSQVPVVFEHQFVGVEQSKESAVFVGEVADGSPAKEADIKSGDRIVAINDTFVKDNQDLSDTVKALAGKEIKITLSDPKKENFKTVNLVPRQNPPQGQGVMGVSLSQVDVVTLFYQTPLQKLLAGPIHSWNLISYSGEIFGKLIGQSFKQKSVEPLSSTVSGPVGITSVANTILTTNKYPLLPYLEFMALLSLNLSILNLLPFPALDGGRLFFLLIEAVIRKRVHPGFERWVHTIGMVILLTLILLITFSDLKKVLP